MNTPATPVPIDTPVRYHGILDEFWGDAVIVSFLPAQWSDDGWTYHLYYPETDETITGVQRQSFATDADDKEAFDNLVKSFYNTRS